MKHPLLPILLLLLLSCQKEDEAILDKTPTNLSTTIIYKEINGINPNLLSLDVYYNDLIESKKPVVVYIHGGGWAFGDKSNQLENKINLFQSLEYVLVSINYRLSPFPYEPDNPNRVMYPTHSIDVADAIKWIVENIGQYGGDATRIALLGHSAGAHLAALAATNQVFLKNVGLSFSNIKGVATIDTEGYDVLAKVQENNELYINAFGTDTHANTQASPILNITNSMAYPKFFVAKRGNPERLAIANNFINTLEQAGTWVAQVDGSTYSHEGINDAIGKPNETLVTNALKQFFEECFQ